MRERLSDYQEQYGDLYNLEATPAESTTYRLAKHDTAKYPDIITAAKKPGDTPYYTNSSHLPVGYTADIFEALSIQDELQTLYTSGTVFHAFLGEKLPDWRTAAALIRKIAENFKLPYYTMSPTYSICQEHGYLTGEHNTCPVCGKVCEVWSRITGYYRPVQNWNDGKVQEYQDRQEYLPDSSKLEGRRLCDREEAAAAPEVTAAEAKLLLFTTKTCPNCKIAKAELDKAGLSYEVLDAAEHVDLVKQYGITQAPTLMVVSGNDAQKLAGAGAIKRFAVDNR
jgi:ribonucleoside-triphosphate reductase